MIFDAKMIWFIAGLILIFSEFLAPGIILIFFGLGAWIVALGLWIGMIESPAMQSIVFAVSSLTLLFLLRRFCAPWFVGATSNSGMEVDEEFIGKTVEVIQSIGGHENTGKIELKGAPWTAYSNTRIEKGSHAVIIKRDGIELTVKAID